MAQKVQPQANTGYGVGEGSIPLAPLPIVAQRAPTTSDTGYPIGQIWINQTADAAYNLTSVSGGSATWVATGGGSSAVSQLTGDSGTAIPTAGSIAIAGTASQITTAASGSTVTLSLPAAITAPGSLTTTTSLAATTTVTAGTGLTVTTGDATVTAGNVILNGAAKQLRVHGGAATDFIGQVTLTNGTADVLNTNIAATDRVIVTRSAKNASTAYGTPLITITPATKFNVTACKSDTTTETNDASTFDYFIVRQV